MAQVSSAQGSLPPALVLASLNLDVDSQVPAKLASDSATRIKANMVGTLARDHVGGVIQVLDNAANTIKGVILGHDSRIYPGELPLRIEARQERLREVNELYLMKREESETRGHTAVVAFESERWLHRPKMLLIRPFIYHNLPHRGHASGHVYQQSRFAT